MKPQRNIEPILLFKGATRAATYFGVPVMPLMIASIVVACFALVISIWCWLILPVAGFIMAQITRYDDRAFSILGLYLDTRFRNRNKGFWQASTYTASRFRRGRK
jgi:type IV secretion system protein VirB3